MMKFVDSYQVLNACTTLGQSITFFETDILRGAPVSEIEIGTCAFANQQ